MLLSIDCLRKEDQSEKAKINRRINSNTYKVSEIK